MHRRLRKFLQSIVLLFLLLQPAFSATKANAARLTLSADEVIATVNALRQSQGLAPYVTDGGLNAYALEHSEYQAKIGQWTHTHSDGRTAVSDGYEENIAAGGHGFLNAQNIVYQIWADPIHMKTMLGYATGAVGAGVASNNSTIFVTLVVSPGNAIAIPTLPGGTPGLGVVYTPIALVPLATVTPRSSGAVVHEVGYGQSLWAIAMAYGVSGDRIRSLNGMAAGDSAIYAGQKLLIIPAGEFTPSPAPAASPSPQIAAAFPTLVSPVRGSPTPVPPLTAVPTISKSAAAAPLLARFDPILFGLIGLAGLGLLLFLTAGVRIRPHH